MQAAHDRQKSYANLKRKPIEFQVGDKVMLKVLPWKGVVRFGKRGKLNPRYVGPFKVIERVGEVAYKLELPEELSRVHNTFYVSNLKKCHADEPLAFGKRGKLNLRYVRPFKVLEKARVVAYKFELPQKLDKVHNTFHVSNLKKCHANEPLVVLLDGLHIDDKLHFVEELVVIMDHNIKQLKQSRIPIVKLDILNILSFEEGKLPVKYLGVPLVPSRLLYRDCSELMEKVKRRISDWKNKSLSLAGRVQLIRFVLGFMHLYWASVFILPTRLMLELEQVMRGFLWCQGEMKRGKAKVAWEAVCLPKKEGGLGISRLEAVNMALITSHIWSLLTCKESLWVRWIHTYKLKGRSFWEILLRGDDAGFRLNAKVYDIIHHGSWCWSNDWVSKYPLLVNATVPHLSIVADRLIWRKLVAVDSEFSVAKVWDCIRPQSNAVDWFHVVWFSQQIPRHVIHLWLVIKRKLKTQDTLRQWDVSSNTNLHPLRCPLCGTQPDSHDHLFFECGLFLQLSLAKMRSARSVIAKLIFDASCYFIWQEQNDRLFMKKKRSQDQVIDIIKSNVRLKLLTC
ncbi:putative RNA-directed DNA polymerase [Tanacetum coccineum]